MTAAITQIDPTEAASRVAGGDVLLLDVRTPDEFAAGHAPRAVLVPVNELGSRLDELDPGVPIVAVCRSGVRSQGAAELLAAHGYDVVNLAGGTIAWHAAGFDLIASDGGPGSVE